MLNHHRRALTLPVLSANQLKITGAVLAAIYFFGLTVVQNGLLHVSRYSAEEINRLAADSGSVFMLSGISSVCYLAGVAAIPIFAFLSVQGILHTRSIKKYILTVLIFAAVSEVPYDLAASGRLLDMSSQNPLWTVFIALVTLWLLKSFQGKGFVPLLINLIIAASGCFWAIFTCSRFGGGFVLLTAVLFWLREHKGAGIFAGAVLSLIYATAPLGFIPVALYSGERKNTEKKSRKYLYYILYAVMLAVFAAIVRILNN